MTSMTDQQPDTEQHGFANLLFATNRMASIFVCRCGKRCEGYTDRLAQTEFLAHLAAVSA